MRRLLVLVLCATAMLTSCVDDQISAVLASAEKSMDDNPKSSLEALESLDSQTLKTCKQKAKYALLYSMALDKNYIDIKTDTIIAPAVKYYEYHGSKRERFLCNYYQARICENAGENNSALLSAVKAESIDTSKVSAEDKCLLYALKGRIYHSEWRIQESIEAYESACRYALASDKFRHYAYYALKVADMYRYDGDMVNSYKYVLDAEKYKPYFTLGEIHHYHRLVLLNMIDTEEDADECLEYAQKYIEEYPQQGMINWHIVARVYLYAGNPDIAYEMLQKYAKYHDVASDASYYGNLADILDLIGNHKEALEAHRTFAALVKKRDVARHLSDIKLVEERFENELTQSRQNHVISYVVGIAVLLLLITVYMNLKWSKERRSNRNDLRDLQQECDALIALKERMDSTYHYLSSQMTAQSYTDYELRMVLGQRIKSLSAFLQNPIPDSLSKVAAQIDDLKKNKNYIVDSIGLLYAVTYPEFVSELRSHDLTSSEIGYCCLYVLGLNIPEAGEVIGRVSSIYNVNSSIRKKLGISGMNLDKWLAKRFGELCRRTKDESGNRKN